MYTVFVRNITFSADELPSTALARSPAAEHKTLNDAFREWLDCSMAPVTVTAAGNRETCFESLRYVNAGRKFTRDEMNERR